ncbi:MAG: leucine-rich repeat domain-containing protein, partial [Solobacterium sp.]|nr:leucine-rich repeat domain-containing protein [Solobacterium sp.]
MQRKSKRFLSVLLSLFMCFSHLVTDVRAEGEEQEPVPVETTEADQEEEPEVTQEEEQPGIVYEEEYTEEAGSTPEPVLCWDGTYAETLEECPVGPEKEEEPETEEVERTGSTETNKSDEEMMRAPALVTGANIITGSCGDACTYEVTEDGVLTISGTGRMADYLVGDTMPSWRTSASEITRIVVNDGITSIGSFAFDSLSNVSEVELPDSLTSIGSNAFYYCSSLGSISIPEGVTYIGEHAFQGCSGLTTIEIPEGITIINFAAFNNCSSLTSITIPVSVTRITPAFDGCSALTDVYYGGTQEQWNALAIDSYNDTLNNATVHVQSNPAENYTYTVENG